MIPSKTNSTPRFGLTQGELDRIKTVISYHAEVEEAIIFGSRAKGNYSPGSDIDIAVKGADVTHVTTSDISYQLNETTQMPYYFDVLNYYTIANKELMDHIDRAGACFFRR